MSQKLVFFDIDGTLYDHDIGVPKSTIEGIHKLLENNHIPIICTGRSRAMIQQDLIDIGFEGVIAAAGADVSYNNEEIEQIVDGTQTAKKVMDLLKEGNIDYLLEGPEYIYYDSDNGSNLSHRVRKMVGAFGREIFKTTDEGEIIFNKISGTLKEDSVIHPDLKEKYDMIMHSAIPVVEMVPKGCNKGQGAKKMVDYLGADRKDTYAFGDSNNDIEMLEYVEYGIAMGNAYEDILAKAKYKTKSIKDDGIYYGLKEFGLI